MAHHSSSRFLTVSRDLLALLALFIWFALVAYALSRGGWYLLLIPLVAFAWFLLTKVLYLWDERKRWP